MSRKAVLSALLGFLMVLASCSGLPSGSAEDQLRIMVPNAAGGGYDTTARTAAMVLEQEGITGRPEIFNLEGASGGAGLVRTVHERGNPNLMMMMGLGVVGALATDEAAAGFGDVTPVARLLSEPEVVMVRSESAHEDLGSLVDAWRAHPGRVVVGGGSLAGGPDHLATYLVAEAVGIDPQRVRYRRYDGGGPLLAALLTGEVDVAMSGVLENIDQVRAGAVRVLAVTGAEPVPGVDAPTLREAGVPLEFANWRGLVAPPGLTTAQRRRLVSIVTKMHDSPSWQAAARANGWTDDFLTGPAFGSFLAAESRRVRGVLARLGVEDARSLTP
ncbi:MAG: Bug family tripartite tricarboxylate transporter substrate binding protein [Nocardioides sp.]